jgi:uncharacterized membrane protein YeiH
MRDVMLGAQPIFWLEQPIYLLLALLAALPVCVWYRKLVWTKGVLSYADAVGLGVFTVIGASKALDFGAGFAGAVVFGCMTGVGGGVIRDVLVREVPLVLKREVYASATIAGSVLFCALTSFGAPGWIALVAGAALTIAIRVFCVARRVHLPRPGGDDDLDES